MRQTYTHTPLARCPVSPHDVPPDVPQGHVHHDRQGITNGSTVGHVSPCPARRTRRGSAGQPGRPAPVTALVIALFAVVPGVWILGPPAVVEGCVVDQLPRLAQSRSGPARTSEDSRQPRVMASPSERSVVL